MRIKVFLDNYFHSFIFFYGYLKYRIFIGLSISVFVGLLDSIGLALFIPLLKLISSENREAALASDNPDFITDLVINKLQIPGTVLNIFLLIFVFFTLKGVAKFFESYIRVLFQQYFMRKIRISNIDHLNKFDFKEFLKSDSGRIQNNFTGEVNRINSAFINYFRAIQYGVLVLVYLLLAIFSDWKFTLFVVLGGVMINEIFNFIYKRTKYYSKKYTSQTHIFQNLLVQKVHLFKYLKATGQNRMYSNKLKNNIYLLENIQKKLGVIEASLGALREPLIVLVVFASIFLNIYLFAETMASILISLILLYRGITFFMATQERWNIFLGVSGTLENLKMFTKELISGKETNGNLEYKGFKNKLELKNLVFEFDLKQPVLKNINLEIFKNETVAIVGESGSGKSTLMSIIAGLLSPTEGNYFIDAIPVGELDLNSFKKHIGYIVQDATIFNDTIYNNISFWAPKTKENLKRFHKTIEKAAVNNYIDSLPNKEDSLLGTNGINISGGQRQRLAIARELYKEVEILFMDEATSALDGETETVIQKNINELRGEFTIVIIAHRLSTIKNVDRIILMKNGTIEQIGNFDELMANSEEFRSMVANQNL